MINHHKRIFFNSDTTPRPKSLRGLICVDRMYKGQLTTFPLVNQWSFKEWVGCYSLLGGL